MYKSSKFSGIPIISQLINLLDRTKINRTAQANQSDPYYKRYKTIDHLTTMIYADLSGCLTRDNEYNGIQNRPSWFTQIS